MMDFEHFHAWRDVLRQVAVHDPDHRLAAAAERALQEHSVATITAVLARSAASTYRPRLMAAYHGRNA